MTKKVRRLDGAFDMTLGRGLSDYAVKSESTAQRVQTRLQLLFGEWFLNIAEGVPYIPDLTSKPIDLPLVEATIKQTIIDTEGVKELHSFDMGFDSETRRLTISGSYATTDGDVENIQIQPLFKPLGEIVEPPPPPPPPPVENDVTPPTIPTGVSANLSGTFELFINWNQSTDTESGVRLYIINRDGVEIGRSITPGFRNAGLAPGIPYSYAVAAMDWNNNISGFSEPYTIMLDEETTDTTPPSVPGGLTATGVSPSQINLAWSPSTDNTSMGGYLVFRNAIQIASVTTPFHSDSGLDPDTDYTYTVAAFDTATPPNVSAESAGVVGATLLGEDTEAPDVPTGLTATPVSSSIIGLSWNPAADNVETIGYKIYKQTPLNLSRIGFVGASMTMGAVTGAKRIGATNLWNPTPLYGGGGLWQWAQNLNNAYWTRFATALAAQPTKVFWLELCALEADKANETLANAIKIVDEIKRRAGLGTVVFVSSQPEYTPSAHTCTLAGEDGPARMAAIAAQLVSGGHCQAGPAQGPLNSATQLKVGDTCHPNTAGEDFLGGQVKTFFDNLTAEYVPVADVATLTYQDEGLTASTSYSYKVAAYDGATPPNISAASTPASATTLASSGSTTGKSIGIYLIDTVLDLPFLSGNLMRRAWKDLESGTVPGQYTFTSIATRISQLPANQKLTLVVFGMDVPAYVTAAASATFINGQTGRSVPVPWDANGQARMGAMMTALSNFQVDGIPLKDHPKLANILCPILGTNDIRVRNTTDIPNYTLALYKQACINCMALTADVFPNKNIYAGIFGVPGALANTEEIRDAIMAIYNGIDKPLMQWYQETMTDIVPDYNSNQGRLVMDVSTQTGIMLQECGEMSNKGPWTQCIFGSGGIQEMLDHIAALGCTYIEIYLRDAQHAPYTAALQAWHDALPPH